LKYISIIIILFLSIFFSCRDDKIIADPSVKLSFSADTVMFDTVFTEIGSTTKKFVVYNNENGSVNIEKIFLAGGTNSNYRLNIDGIKDFKVDNVLIKSKDSLFIFVEVTVDPTNINTPMVVKDSIIFITNTNVQDVNLVAFGQDYHLINGQYVNTQTWINDKPYLVYNSMAVDSAESLTIEEGCQIHFHHNSSLYVLGSLIVQGTLDNPVVFQGDRLESIYDDIPGQWGYIHLLRGSHDNVIDYAIIKNSIIGLQVDTFLNNEPSLIISNSRIENVNAVGIFAQGAIIQANNCVISNCGQYALALTIGGDYQFYHCTIGNYWTFGTRTTPSLVLNDYYTSVNGNIIPREIENAYFGNCIIYGANESEIVIDDDGFPGGINYRFEHCIVRTNPDMELPSERFINCIVNIDPLFIDANENNLELDTLSLAKDAGDNVTAQFFPYDIKGVSRLSDNAPDLGAYERIENQ